MIIRAEDVVYAQAPEPENEAAKEPVELTDLTMSRHRLQILSGMEREGLDALAVYADREHGTNFGYLTGFEPRFEEAVLVLLRDGSACLLLGNECMPMHKHVRIPAGAVHVPCFSLPNQPMDQGCDLEEALRISGIEAGMSVGIVGWKLFTGSGRDGSLMFDVPYFIVNAVMDVIGTRGKAVNAAGLFIHPETGARVTVNANEIAHYEFGASLAGRCMLRMLNRIGIGKSELELADSLAAFGQPASVQTICASGERFTNAAVAPRARRVCAGDKFTATMGLRGGLTNRAGYVVHNEEELTGDVRDYLERIAKPYYAAAATWFSTVGIGVGGGRLFEAVEAAAPRMLYGWSLNPGHLTAGEEWMSSPVWEGSPVKLKSGMMLQMDIIFRVAGYGGANAEDGVVLADENLRSELKRWYPEVWGRMEKRREYMTKTLGIPLKDEVLLMSPTAGYLRPFLLEKNKALRIL